MPKAEKLSREEIESALRELPGWRLMDAKLIAEFKFKTFPEAFSFMTRVAFEAERRDHHPDWTNSYNRVRIELTTHDAGGVTRNDLDLARAVAEIDWTGG